MKALFADTFYWIALTLPRDAAYAHAQTITAELVTTDEVLSKYLTFFSRAPHHLRTEAAIAVGVVSKDASVRVIPHSRDTFLSGLDLYTARPDKGYSLTDCISMAPMRPEGLTEVLTNDRHFEQEGFRVLFHGF